MKAKLFLFLFALISTNLFAQHTIEGKFTGIAHKNIYLMDYLEGRQQIIDTTQTDENGSFNFTLDKSKKPGIYIVYAGPEHLLELV